MPDGGGVWWFGPYRSPAVSRERNGLQGLVGAHREILLCRGEETSLFRLNHVLDVVAQSCIVLKLFPICFNSQATLSAYNMFIIHWNNQLNGNLQNHAYRGGAIEEAHLFCLVADKRIENNVTCGVTMTTRGVTWLSG